MEAFNQGINPSRLAPLGAVTKLMDASWEKICRYSGDGSPDNNLITNGASEWVNVINYQWETLAHINWHLSQKSTVNESAMFLSAPSFPYMHDYNPSKSPSDHEYHRPSFSLPGVPVTPEEIPFALPQEPRAVAIQTSVGSDAGPG